MRQKLARLGGRRLSFNAKMAPAFPVRPGPGEPEIKVPNIGCFSNWTRIGRRAETPGPGRDLEQTVQILFTLQISFPEIVTSVSMIILLNRSHG